MDWGQIFGQPPSDHLGHFLDRYDSAALETTSRVMGEHARSIMRARNEDLPVEQRMANLEAPLCVSVVPKELMRRRDICGKAASGSDVHGRI